MEAVTGIRRRGGRARTGALIVSVCLVLSGLATGAGAETPLTTVGVSSLTPVGVTIDLPPIPGSNPRSYYAHYRFEADGTFIYDSVSTGNIADAECTRFGSSAGNLDPTWQKDRWGTKTQDPLDDLYDLYVDGKAVEWKPANGETDCATEDNVYEKTFAAAAFNPDPSTGRKKVSFRVYDENYGNNVDISGGLVVRIFQGGEPPQGPNDRFIETVTVNTRERAGAATVSALVAGERYRFVGRGSYSYSVTNDGWVADAECSITGNTDPNVAYDPVWKSHRTFIAGDSRDYLDLLVSGVERAWAPLVATTPGCNTRDHSYKYEFQPATSDRVGFTVQSPNHEFNSGFLFVDIYLTRSEQDPPPSGADVVDAGLAQDNRQPSTDTPLLTFNVSAASRIPKEITLPGQTQPNGSIKYFTNYRFEVGGVYVWDYNDGGNLADAECAKFARGRVGQDSAPIPDPTWQQNRFGATKFAEKRTQEDVSQDPLDLYVNGVNVTWTPLIADGKGCNSQNNTYDYIMPITTSRRVQFEVYDPISDHAFVADTRNLGDGDSSNDFSFTVKVFPAPEARSDPAQHTYIETVKVDTRKPQGTSSLAALVAGQRYRFVVSNFYTYEYRTPATSLADAECTITPTDATWQPQRTFPGVPAHDDLYGLYLDRADAEWVPLFDTGEGCNTSSNHTYRLIHTAMQTAQVNFAVKAMDYSFLSGSLFVDIFLMRAGVADGERPGLPVPGVEPAMSKEPSKETPTEVIKIQAASDVGSNSQKSYQKGQNYRLEVSGVYVYDYRYTTDNRADAECTQFAFNPRTVINNGNVDFTVPERSWQSKRFATNANDPGGDPFDLEIDGAEVEWIPLTPDPTFPACNTKDHTYEYLFSPLENIDGVVEKLNFKIADPMFLHAFAAGELMVKVFPAGTVRNGPEHQEIEDLQVDASNPTGTNTLTPLREGETYRIIADGVFNYDKRRDGAKADAECTITDSYPSTDPVYKAQRNWDSIAAGDDMFDLMINGVQVEWTPLFETSGGCNARDHAYSLTFTATRTDFANFRVRHTYHAVASGTLKVEIYILRPGAPGSGSSEFVPRAAPTTGDPIAVTTVSAAPGSVSEVVLPGYINAAGQTRYHSYYLFQVNGTYAYNKDISGNSADAECTTGEMRPTSGTTVPDRSWQANRYPLGAFPLGSTNPATAQAGGDALDLYVDDGPVEWIPTVADATSALCNSSNHTYQLNHRKTQSTVKFAVFDPFNAGTKNVDGAGTYSFTVKIYAGAEPVSTVNDVLVQVLNVDSTDAAGSSTVPLLAGRRYRFVADGVYAWDKRRPDQTADAECSVVADDPVYRARRSWGNGSVSEGVELLDLVMNEQELSWVPLFDPAGTGCNSTDHVYRHIYTPPQNESVIFRIRHPYRPVASGALMVRVYLMK